MKCPSCGGFFDTPFGLGDTCRCSKTQRRLSTFLARQDLDTPKALPLPFWILSAIAMALILYGCSVIERGLS